MIWRSDRSKFEDLSTETALETLIEDSRSRPVVLYKHSRICGLSYRAQREMEAFSREGSTRVGRLVIQRARALSAKIEALFGIRHESPQVIVLFRGVPVFDASHRGVTARAVRDALADIQTDDN